MNRRLLALLALAAGLLAAVPVFATSMLLLDMETHLADSTVVVEAVVGSFRIDDTERVAQMKLDRHDTAVAFCEEATK